MNREFRRNFVKQARKNGVSTKAAENYIDVAKNGTGEHTARQNINNGDLVKINIEAVKARQNYDKMSEKYKEFVDENKDTVFTAFVESDNLISFKENRAWLFWSGDLEVIQTPEYIEVLEGQEGVDSVQSI